MQLEDFEVWENPVYERLKKSHIVKELDEITEIKSVLKTLVKIAYGLESYNRKVVEESFKKLEEFVKSEV